MRKIKNDPSTYLKRSDLGRPQRGQELEGEPPVKLNRKDWFLTAHIDERGYVDFRSAAEDTPKKRAL